MKKTILILSAIMLFAGCGSDDVKKKNIDDNRTQESNLTTPPKNTTVDYTIPLKYEYNKDGSATQKLAPLYVNKYKEIEKKLNDAKNDSHKFRLILNEYIGGLYRGTDSLRTLQVYAPNGEAKSQIVTVNNGQLDYSSYKLKGDVNFDWEVNIEDLNLLSEAILNDIESFQYDVNGDGKVDVSDIIDVASRLGNEIKYFDFYTTDGTKLSIDTRSSDEEKSFTYTGSETAVMVVAKDRNHASSYENGLSDSDDVWYKQEGWVLKKIEPITKKLNKSTKKQEELDVVLYSDDLSDNFVKLELEADDYLVGCNFDFVELGAANTKYPALSLSVNKEPLLSYVKKIGKTVNGYFSNTDMGHPPIVNISSREYTHKIGALIDRDYEAIHFFNTLSFYSRKDKEGHYHFVEILQEYLWEMSIYSSPKSYMLTGELIRNDEKEAKGTVVVGRIGPGKKEDILTGEIEDSIFSVENASFGTYNINYLDECSCSNDLGEYIFDKEGKTPEYKLKSTKVKTKLQLLDKENEPINKKTIKIVAKPCVNSDDDEKSFSSVSDANGYVDFSNVPIGDYNVYVDGKENSEIHFCEAYNGKLTGKKLWDIDFKYVSKSTGGQSSVFEGTGEWHWKKIKIASITDPVTSLETAMQLEEEQNIFPLRIDGGSYGSILMLTKTTFFDNAEYGLNLHYIESGSKKYCVTIDEGLLDNHVRALHPSRTHDELSYAGYFFTTSCGEDPRGIDNSLSNSNINAMKEYREFTVQSTGSWTNDMGKTTMTVKFTPSN